MTKYSPSSFSNQIISISQYELLQFVRGKKILGMIAITVITALIFLILPELFEGLESTTAEEFVSGPIGAMFFLLVLVGVLFGSGSIVSEFHEKTGYTLFTNPVKNTTIWFGKFLAAEIIALGVVCSYYLIIFLGTIARFSDVPAELAISFSFSLVAVTMLMSVSFLISSVLRGPTGAAVLVFFIFILLFPISDGMISTMAQIKPWFSPNFSAGIIHQIITVPYPVDQSIDLPFGEHVTIYAPDIFPSLGMMGIYIAVCSVVSILIFNRRELG